VRELLNHTSGLADSGELRAVKQARDTGSVPVRKQVRLVNAEHRSFAPGARWKYSNTDYLVAGLLIERLTGHDLGQVLTSRLFGPSSHSPASQRASPTATGQDGASPR
jgi:D-alanyl-D-alanine carboxypeptidase